MIGHVAVETQSTKPPICQVEVHLLAQAPFRADAEAVADDQHADQQLRIDRRPTDGAVKRRQLLPQPIEFYKSVDRAQQMRHRNMLLKRKLVKQSVLPDAVFPHHQTHSDPPTGLNQLAPARATPYFFNGIEPNWPSDRTSARPSLSCRSLGGGSDPYQAFPGRTGPIRGNT